MANINFFLHCSMLKAISCSVSSLESEKILASLQLPFAIFHDSAFGEKLDVSYSSQFGRSLTCIEEMSVSFQFSVLQSFSTFL